jgi:2-polyprenyl-6-methoxyphenol hydroxylase-like FAD-dependent oxidoreductase
MVVRRGRKEDQMRAIICGGGIAGWTLAWWLDHNGWQVLLVEQAPGPRTGGYMIDFFGSGYDVTELMGVLPALRRAHVTVDEVKYVDPNERGVGGIGYDRLAGLFDGRILSLLRGDLERILRDAVNGRTQVRYGTTINAITQSPDTVQAQLSDGTVERADLLVGADGVHSRVRNLVFGPEHAFLRYLGYHTASYLLADDDNLRPRIGDRFLMVGVPGRQAGLYPTGDGRLATSFIHATPSPAPPPDPQATLRRGYADLGGLIRRVLRKLPADRHEVYYDQVAQVEMDSWSRGRVVLVGDACHAVSLMAGQGASMAVGGAYVLADELARGGDIAEATSRYEQRIRPLVTEKQQAGRSTARWFVPTSQWRITIRRIALAAARVPGAVSLLRAALAPLRASVVPADRRASATTV